MPRRSLQYHGVTLEELDLDAVLTRRPTVALIDELAHTNAPGSRNGKRYQDVEEILRAGIHVISTLNIQHMESLHDIVEQATGIRVKERIPDYIVGTADQLVNVDVSAEDLRERLLAGKVYPEERIQTVLENFFQLTHLNQLRELAMKEIVNGSGSAAHMRVSPVENSHSERVAVALELAQPEFGCPVTQDVPPGRPFRCAVVRDLRADSSRNDSTHRRCHAPTTHQDPDVRLPVRRHRPRVQRG